MCENAVNLQRKECDAEQKAKKNADNDSDDNSEKPKPENNA